MATLHLEIRGRVQGVGFRWFVREIARRSDLKGWVRNTPAGRVEIAVAGPDGAVAELVSAARSGPPGAEVEAVTELPAGELGDLPHPFTVFR